MYQGIRIAGFGGQGVVSAGVILAQAGMIDGKEVSFFPSYGAEMRGGTANCSVVIASEEVTTPIVSEPDTVIVLNEPSLAKFEPMVKPGGLLIINSSLVNSKPKRTDIKIISAPFNEIAYASRSGPGFDIKVLDLSTGQTKAITFGEGTNESPAFSPNGRHIVFTSTRSGKTQVFTMARDGKDVRQITKAGNNYEPDWSK